MKKFYEVKIHGFKKIRRVSLEELNLLWLISESICRGEVFHAKQSVHMSYINGLVSKGMVYSRIVGPDYDIHGIPASTIHFKGNPTMSIRRMYLDTCPLNLVDHNRYYVYTCSINNSPVYVGKGTGDRWRHAGSGNSHNDGLNNAVISGETIITTKIVENLTDEAAHNIEKVMIDNLITSGHNLLNKREGEK